MKRGFAAVLWGDFLKDNTERLDELKEKFNYDFNPKGPMDIRRTKIERNIRSFAKQEYAKDSTVYVFGKENYENVISKGLNAVLYHEDPYVYHPTRRIYMHKMDAYRQIMEDFDEVVLLDFDIILKGSLPRDFWERLNQREVFQASIHRYSTPRINHRPRTRDNKYISAGAFAYMRDKTLADKIWELNKVLPNKWSVESSFSKLCDDLGGGWQGVAHYWKYFEPEFYTSQRTPYKNKEVYPKPDKCFSHGNWTRGA